MSEQSSNADADSVSYGTLLRDSRFLLTLLISFTGGLGLSAIPVALPVIAESLAVSDERVGMVVTAFALPGIVMIPIVGVIADSYGRRPVVLSSLALFGVSGVATFAVSSFEALLVISVFLGIAFPGTLPLSTTLIGDLYTGPTGAAAQGVRASVNGVARVISPAIAGVLAGFAWNYPFGLFLIAFPVLGLTYLYFSEPVSIHRGSTETKVTTALSQYWTAFREETADVLFLLLAVGGFMNLFVRQAILVFVPLFAVRSVGVSLFATGLVLSAYGAIRVIFSPLAGEFVAFFGRKRTLIVAIGLMGLGVGALPFTTDVVVVGALVVVFGAGEAVFIPSFNDSMAAFASDDRRGGIIGSIQSLKSLGRAVAPSFFGFLLAVAGFPAVFVAAALIAGLYVVALSAIFDPDSIGTRAT